MNELKLELDNTNMILVGMWVVLLLFLAGISLSTATTFRQKEYTPKRKAVNRIIGGIIILVGIIGVIVTATVGVQIRDSNTQNVVEWADKTYSVELTTADGENLIYNGRTITKIDGKSTEVELVLLDENYVLLSLNKQELERK